MLPAAAAAVTAAAAEHGVAGDPLARPGRIHPGADRGDGTAPFVTEPYRVRRVALMQVRHVAGEKLDVGTAHPGAFDVHHDLAGAATGGSTSATVNWRGPVSTNARCPALPDPAAATANAARAGCWILTFSLIVPARYGRKTMSRTAVITGGASGIGRASAQRLGQDGITVVTLDVSGDADVVADVTDPAAVGAAIEAIGPVDILVNSAGIVGPNKPLWEVSDQDGRRLAVNVTGTFHLCRAVVPGMRDRGWGRIVNLASMAGKDGNPRLGAYSASKAAVIGMTKSLGKELATSGVLVNAIAPAVIETPMNAADTPEVLEYMTSLIPMHRLGRPEEVAELVAWLASDKCSFSTGAVYDLSGGRATY